MPFIGRGVQDTIARDRAFNAAHESTRAGIEAEAQRKGWKLTKPVHHDPVARRTVHEFANSTHSIAVIHSGAERMTCIVGRSAPSEDQHTRNLAAISDAMKGAKFLGTGITHGGRHVHHYQTPTHDVLVAHIGNEMTTYSKPR